MWGVHSGEHDLGWLDAGGCWSAVASGFGCSCIGALYTHLRLAETPRGASEKVACEPRRLSVRRCCGERCMGSESEGGLGRSELMT